MSEAEQPELSENEQILIRKQKLNNLRADTNNPFPNDFKPQQLAAELFASYHHLDSEALEAKHLTVSLAGRIMTRRLMGKASFVHIQDRTGRIQLYVKQESLGLSHYETFKKLDIGDIIGITGTLFKTKTQELSIKVTELQLLVKTLRPLPDKWHGLSSQEIRYRKRYLDLLMNKETRHTFTVRSQVVQAIRNFLTERAYLEVETPMMHIIPGGATARPFVTHHNALDMKLYLRIAPELFLKRLVVGGFERVFEINRNFRNEGLSTRHNPEFTMIEFYEAYATYHDFMDLTERLFQYITNTVLGTTQVQYGEQVFDFAKPFTRLTLEEAVLQYNPAIAAKDIKNKAVLGRYLESHNLPADKNWEVGKLQLEIFEQTVEEKLQQPCFITEFPIEVSPLARKNVQNPLVADRAELFIGGREIANIFSELNDPEDQAVRFQQQVAELAAGDEEAMHFDADYIHALEYGLPPTAGEGIGIDRLVMLLTNSHTIRDVLLFPHMRKEA